jgi:putative ABC transport system permease protein
MFCLLTILLSGLGLFCIVTYDSAARMKEIGIRKLLGASEWNIAFLVSKHFLKLVLVAYVLALPSGWMLTRNWISDFAYKTEVSWWIFALAGFALFLITVLTLGYQSIRISRVDPVDNLRRE